MSVRIKILYGENYSRCKVQSIAKETLLFLTLEEFKRMVTDTVGGFLDGVDVRNTRIQYRDDESTFVTMKDEFDLQDALRCLSAVPNTDGVFRMCVRINDEVTPVGKTFRKPVDSDTSLQNTELCHREESRESRKRRLHFDTDLLIFEAESLEFASRESKVATPEPVELKESCASKVRTPIERYIAKTEENILEKERKLQELVTEESNINSRIQAAKANNAAPGVLCHKCHMRLGHTARNCCFDDCTTVYQCGEERFHVGEVNLKHLKQNILKLKTEKEKLNEELNIKKRAAENLQESILNRLENSLLEADPTSYNVSGYKNWSLLRKHVFVLRKYCEKTLKGKIPPKHEIINCLRIALRSDESRDCAVKQSKPPRGNPSKQLLEGRYGIQFPTESGPSCFKGKESCGYSLIHRIEPKTRDEENEQLRLALNASYQENKNHSVALAGNTYSRLPTCTQTSTSASTSSSAVSKESTSEINDAASALLSLRKS